MTKEKLNSLLKYENSLKDRLTSDIPSKHKHRPESYKNFLKNELRLVSSKIEAVRFQGVPTK